MTHSVYERFLSFHYEYVYPGYYEDYNYTNYFQIGLGDVAGGYPGPYWQFYGHDDSPYGSASVTDGTFAWNVDLSGSDTYYTEGYFEVCGDYTTGTASGVYTGGSAVSDDVACGSFYYGYAGDVFDLYISAEDAAAGNFQASADTINEGTTGDLVMWVSDEDSCLLTVGDDEHDCTFVPPNYGCPSINEALGQGSYKLVVAAYGSCDDTTVEYSVDATNGEIALTNDDFEPASVSTDWALSASGSVSLTE